MGKFRHGRGFSYVKNLHSQFSMEMAKDNSRYIYCWSSWIWYSFLMETMLGDKASEVMIQTYGREIHQMPNWPVMTEFCVWLSWKECWPGLMVLVLGWYSCRHLQTAVAGNYSYIRFSSLLSKVEQTWCKTSTCPRVPSHLHEQPFLGRPQYWSCHWTMNTNCLTHGNAMTEDV